MNTHRETLQLKNSQEQTNVMPKITWSIEQIAEYTTLSKAFLRLEIKRGKLKVRRFGRRVLIRDEDLREYIENGSDGGGQMELNG